MEGSYDDYERFRALDLGFHAIVMKASGNEVGLTIVRAIHRHGGRHAAPAPRRRAPRSPERRRAAGSYEALLLATASSPATGRRHIDSAWAERDQPLAASAFGTGARARGRSSRQCPTALDIG